MLVGLEGVVGCVSFREDRPDARLELLADGDVFRFVDVADEDGVRAGSLEGVGDGLGEGSQDGCLSGGVIRD